MKKKRKKNAAALFFLTGKLEIEILAEVSAFIF